MYSITGDNPTQLYYQAIQDLINEGDECAPRGKRVKELRPAFVEFTQPFNRVSFLRTRHVNPFFMLAEAWWIISGRADVEWLTKFNANMSSFSDDGVWFNAPYGERLRTWGKNAAHNIVLNPLDQLRDAYIKLADDKDTRQAVMVISNPHFDNSRYTLGERGKDIACNLVVTFKIRDNKLHMTVFNRSNDVHWGLWGANLNQFTSIQELMASWLAHSGIEGYDQIVPGTYCQVTDSLHMYLDDYGSACTDDIVRYYDEHGTDSLSSIFVCNTEPRMQLSLAEFDDMTSLYWASIDPYIMDDEFLLSKSQNVYSLLDYIGSIEGQADQPIITDPYWSFAFASMVVYRLAKLGKVVLAVDILSQLTNCQWKVSMMHFLHKFIDKLPSLDRQRAMKQYAKSVDNLADHLIHTNETDNLRSYLLGE